MGNVVPIRPAGAVPGSCGGCPDCGQTDGYVNAGPDHWFICVEHGLKWCAGSNIFSGWRDEDDEARAYSFDLLRRLRAVAPLPRTDHRGSATAKWFFGSDLGSERCGHCYRRVIDVEAEGGSPLQCCIRAQVDAEAAFDWAPIGGGA